MPAPVKRTIQIEIAGQKLSIRSSEGSEYVQRLADHVDARLRDLSGAKRASYNLQRAALLVAMQIADDLFREKDLNRRFQERVHDKLASLEQAMKEHEARLQALT